jgi:hypothetical protein
MIISATTATLAQPLKKGCGLNAAKAQAQPRNLFPIVCVAMVAPHPRYRSVASMAPPLHAHHPAIARQNQHRERQSGQTDRRSDGRIGLDQTAQVMTSEMSPTLYRGEARLYETRAVQRHSVGCPACYRHRLSIDYQLGKHKGCDRWRTLDRSRCFDGSARRNVNPARNESPIYWACQPFRPGWVPGGARSRMTCHPSTASSTTSLPISKIWAFQIWRRVVAKIRPLFTARLFGRCRKSDRGSDHA